MSKSRGNTLSPQELMQTSGADILRLWVASSDYTSDIRFGPGILQGTAESYRKLRNTLRWMLGNLAHHDASETLATTAMPELERLMLHRLAELSEAIRKAYAEYDYKRVIASLSHFMNTDLSAFYFDIRKDALYCEPYSSAKRKAALATIEHIFRALTLWLAPLLCFTAEEAWLARYPSGEGSVHLETFPDIPAAWRDDKLADKWAKIRRVRGAVTGALEHERANKRIGSSLEAAPQVFIADSVPLMPMNRLSECARLPGLAIAFSRIDGSGSATRARAPSPMTPITGLGEVNATIVLAVSASPMRSRPYQPEYPGPVRGRCSCAETPQRPIS